MRKQIVEVPLSVEGIGQAEDEIDKYAERINRQIRDFLQALVNEGMEIYQAYIANADTLSPIREFNVEQKTDAHSAYFKVTDKIAVFIEFGTGLAGKSAPHPQAGDVGWGYNLGEHIAEDGSWFYPSDENDPNPYKWHTKDGKIYAWTRQGIPSRPYIHYTADDMRREIPKIAKEMFK